MEDEGGTPMFPSLGKHCNLEECRRLDFLPFKCDACNRYFCADHRHYENHACNAAAAIVVIGICDICKKGIRRKAGQADHVTLAQHKQSEEEECVRSDTNTKKKERCPVARCKSLLTFTTSVVCKRCRVKTCLSHRFAEDHGCACASASVSASVGPPPVLPRPRVR